MSNYKCKKCGKEINIDSDAKTVICEFCNNDQEIVKEEADILESKYLKALEYKKENKQREAIRAFNDVYDYKDSAKHMSELCLEKYRVKKICLSFLTAVYGLMLLVVIILVCISYGRDKRFTYSPVDGGYEIVYYEGKDSKLSIPSRYNGKKVVSIAKCIGKYRDNIKELIIPETITNIDEDVFKYCKNLEIIKVDSDNKVYDSRNDCNAIIETSTNRLIKGCKNTVIPNEIERISKDAFYECNLRYSNYNNGAYFGNSENPYQLFIKTYNNIETCVLNENTMFIYNNAFAESSIARIEIPEGVKWISEEAFYYCEELTSVKLPDSLESIWDGAFVGCKNLTNIEIPKGVINVGPGSFDDCDYLTRITVDSNNTALDSRNNCNAIIETSTNKLVQGCSTTVIPTSVTTIGDKAFHNLDMMKSIDFPEGLTSIGNYAFNECRGLTNIDLPESLLSIGEGAFMNCTSLNINFNSKANVGKHAFYKCLSLESIVIGGNVIEELAFAGCSNLVSVVILDSVTTIGEGAFYKCEKLESITIPNSVENIEYAAFCYCESLKNVVIPNSVTNIGEYAFYSCTNLDSIIIPKSVTSIGYEAFDHCYNLTIYCEAKKAPKGWEKNEEGKWIFGKEVIWGYKK